VFTLALVAVVIVTILPVLFEAVDARPCDHDSLPPYARIATDDLPDPPRQVQNRSQLDTCHRHRSPAVNLHSLSLPAERLRMLEIIRSVSQN